MRKAFALLVVLGLFVFVGTALAQSQNDPKAAPDPLVKLLESKGILTPAEAASVSKASSPAEANQALASLLLSKGLITQQEYAKTVQAYSPPPAASVIPTAAAPASAQMIPAVLRGTSGGSSAASSGQPWESKLADILPGGAGTTDAAFGTIEPASPSPEPVAGPAVIPAFAPVRVLPVGLMGRESVKPIINAGPIHIQPYGFFKMNVIEDSSNPAPPFGGDAPLPGMLSTDLGPNAHPQFHLNARASRFGANFEWLDPNSKLVITGKLEADFEGNFTAQTSRNVSTVRSSTLGIRLAYGRLDYHYNDRFGVFSEFGQDWTPFCSSTLPSSNETTLLGVGFGSCYERDMQARFGFNYSFAGSRHFQIQPEFAIAYPGLGANPGNTTATACTNAACTKTATVLTSLGLVNQLAFGEQVGADANQPEYQGRFVVQFQLDKAPGVAPAQLIVSGMTGKGKSIVLSSAVPAAFAKDFPGGASTSFRTFGYSAEAQLPTRWFTLQGKFWAGQALRFYFVDNLLNTFNPIGAAFAAHPGGGVLTAPTIDAASTVAFGCGTVTTAALTAGTPCPADEAIVLPQLPVRGVGGFGDLGIPLSRLFHANPAGRNAGWTLDLGYNVDQSEASDLRQAFASATTGAPSTAGGRFKNDWGRATLNYKLNSWVLIGFEEGYYRTRSIPGTKFVGPLVINGQNQRSWHDLHEQISTIFFF